MAKRTKIIIMLMLISVAYAAISWMGPEIGPISNPLKQVKCLEIAGRPYIFASGPLMVLATDSPSMEVQALGEDGSIAWKLELPGRVTSASWWKDRVALGTDLGTLLVVNQDGSILAKMKFNEAVQFLSWNEEGRLALVTSKVTPEGEVISTLQLPIKIELGGRATYLGWMSDKVLIVVRSGEAEWLEIVGKTGVLIRREITGEVLDAAEYVAISMGGKTLLLDEKGGGEEVSIDASVGCWRQDKLYLGSRSGLYLYDGSLRRLFNGSVVDISCGNKVAAAVEWNGSWFIYLDGETFSVEGQPSDLMWSTDGTMLAFSLQYEGKTGIITAAGGLENVRGRLLGWAGRKVAVYRDGGACLIPP